MSYGLVEKHYGRGDVGREIAEFSAGRWVAVHCELKTREGGQIMLRYLPKTKAPLQISSPQDFHKLFHTLRRFMPRAFYASANLYRSLKSREETLDRGNMVAATPTWDVDPVDGGWEKVIEAVEEVVAVLERFGVSRSVFVKWSGRGAHVHIHHMAFSPELRRKIHPLDIAYSVTEYVALRVGRIGGVVENRIDACRVFTSPLSLHRKLSRVAVCIPLNKLREFEISWTAPERFRHDGGWRRYEEGEGDELAERAFRSIGPYIYGGGKRRVHKPLDQQINETLKRLGGIP